MYDMDTCYGLNNEGVLNFGYGLEQHDKDIYNGENSLFWNNFEQVYEKEIKDMYLSLRSSGKLSYDNMMMIFKQNQIDKMKAYRSLGEVSNELKDLMKNIGEI